MRYVPLSERFWPKVNKSEDCWLWTAAKTKGYGVIGVGKSLHYAHRIAYELLVGPIPEGMELDHLCRTPACVRPSHLEPVTHATNLRRGYWGAKTHCPQGHVYDEGNTKLSANGWRLCRICQNAAMRRWYARRKEQASA